jgi:hypothetical protein
VRYRRPYYSAAPPALRRAQTQKDNIALVPASELASLGRWAAATRHLPPGSVLVVSQSDNLRLRAVGQQIDRALRQRGRSAAMVTIPR